MSEAIKANVFRGRAVVAQPGFEDILVATLGGVSLEKV
jgi:hypothetical protein